MFSTPLLGVVLVETMLVSEPVVVECPVHIGNFERRSATGQNCQGKVTDRDSEMFAVRPT